MNCRYPEHHSSGGGWGGPIAAIFAAMIAAVVLGPLLHWLEIALACIGVGTAITAGLVVRRRWRQRQALTARPLHAVDAAPAAAAAVPRRSSRLRPAWTAGSTCTCTSAASARRSGPR